MKKSLLSVFTGVLGQAIMLAIGFVLPRLYLLHYGSEVHGLLSSSSQIMSYLSLFEAGVGSAAIQALYGSIASKDTRKINGILSATNRYYWKTGWAYIIALLPFSLLYPMFLNTTIPHGTITLIMLISGVSGALPFFYHAKYTLLLGAEGKFYIINGVNILVSAISGALRIVLITSSVDIVALQLVYILLAIAQAIIYTNYFKRNYSWLYLGVTPDYGSISQKGAALLHQVSSLIFGNTDMIIITFVLGLKTVSIYAIYSLVFGSVNALINNIYSGIRSKLGQIRNTNVTQYRIVYGVFEPLFTALSFSLICVALVVVIPFVKLYTAGVEGTVYTDSALSLYFAAIQLLIAARLPIFDTVYFAGHIRATQYHTVIESAINISLSLLLVGPLGIYGILIGTVVALTIRTAIMAKFVSKHEKSINLWQSFGTQLLNMGIFAGCVLLSRKLFFPLNTYLELMVGTVAYLAIFVIVFVGINAIIFTDAIRKFLQQVAKTSA